MKLKKIKKPLSRLTIGVLIGIIFGIYFQKMNLLTGDLPLVMFLFFVIIIHIFISKIMSIGYSLSVIATILLLNKGDISLGIPIVSVLLILETIRPESNKDRALDQSR